MEQEPVYVPSGKLVQACEDALGRIYDIRQSDKERYVTFRCDQHNAAVAARNHKRRWLIKLFGAKPDMFITPHGMELTLRDEVGALAPELAQQHPMIQIHSQYGQIEHEAKDAMVMAKLSDAVPISAGFARGLSHLGVDPGVMRKPPFGFSAR